MSSDYNTIMATKPKLIILILFMMLVFIISISAQNMTKSGVAVSEKGQQSVDFNTDAIPAASKVENTVANVFENSIRIDTYNIDGSLIDFYEKHK